MPMTRQREPGPRRRFLGKEIPPPAPDAAVQGLPTVGQRKRRKRRRVKLVPTSAV